MKVKYIKNGLRYDGDLLSDVGGDDIVTFKQERENQPLIIRIHQPRYMFCGKSDDYCICIRGWVVDSGNTFTKEALCFYPMQPGDV